MLVIDINLDIAFWVPLMVAEELFLLFFSPPSFSSLIFLLSIDVSLIYL